VGGAVGSAARSSGSNSRDKVDDFIERGMTTFTITDTAQADGQQNANVGIIRAMEDELACSSTLDEP